MLYFSTEVKIKGPKRKVGAQKKSEGHFLQREGPLSFTLLLTSMIMMTQLRSNFEIISLFNLVDFCIIFYFCLTLRKPFATFSVNKIKARSRYCSLVPVLFLRRTNCRFKRRLSSFVTNV